MFLLQSDELGLVLWRHVDSKGQTHDFSTRVLMPCFHCDVVIYLCITWLHILQVLLGCNLLQSRFGVVSRCFEDSVSLLRHWPYVCQNFFGKIITPKIWQWLIIRYVHAKLYYNKGIFLRVSGRQYLTLLFITFGSLCGAIYSKTLVCFFKIV